MRLIDADELKERLIRIYKEAYKWRNDAGLAEDHILYERADGEVAAYLEAIMTLNNAPTIDAVPVVRCKDCKWFKRYAELKTRETGFCSVLKPEGDGHFICWGDWYCGDGERRMEDDSN